jgi:hypothetical protein
LEKAVKTCFPEKEIQKSAPRKIEGRTEVKIPGGLFTQNLLQALTGPLHLPQLLMYKFVLSRQP